MRCNIFKPLSCPTGEFLTFQQYTNDLTKAQAEGHNYRVVPSKFVVLDVDLLKVFNIIEDDNHNYIWNDQSIPPFLWYNPTPPNNLNDPVDLQDSIYVWDPAQGYELKGYNNILPQIFQSAYENAMSKLVNEQPGVFEQNNPEYSRLLLWTILKQAGFLTEAQYTPQGETQSLTYWEEIKYVGDINFHTDRSIDAYDYNEIYCHIPSDEKDYIYPISPIQEPENFINRIPTDSGTYINFTDPLEGWSDLTYPTGYILKNNTLFSRLVETAGGGYYGMEGNDLNVFQSGMNPGRIDPDRSQDDSEYHFNTIIIFYDVYNDEPDSPPLYSNRPMGIYFTGMVNAEERTGVPSFGNEFTKYITNVDAYGQGAAFGLRLMTRIVPTPNSSSYQITVSAGDNVDEYNTITTALGRLGDAIIQTNHAIADMHALTETIKDHLALFKNNRTNIPYVRLVGDEPYWFVNGRNTGMKVYQNND